MRQSMCFFLGFCVAYAQVPLSPFGKQKDICPQGNNFVVKVNGFPSSPFLVQPFKDWYKPPQTAQPKFKACRNDTHCILSYEFDIKDVQLRPFDNAVQACKNKPGTWFLTYNARNFLTSLRVGDGVDFASQAKSA
ncbi:hypothetical protein EBU95_05360 [bacterium]|nr:hypothetical protein [bacterium]